QIDARDVGTAVNLAQVAIQDRRYDEAIALLRPAAADEPYNITAAYNLGLALTRAGRREEGQRLMESSQALRTTGYGTTFSNAYLEQGKYAEAVASTGAEPELVDRTRPAVVWNVTSIAASGVASSNRPISSPFGKQFAAS